MFFLSIFFVINIIFSSNFTNYLCSSDLTINFVYTLSGRIGKVIASHAAVARSIPAEVTLIYAMHDTLRGYCP